LRQGARGADLAVAKATNPRAKMDGMMTDQQRSGALQRFGPRMSRVTTQETMSR